MAEIPDPINSIAALIDKAHEDRPSRPRPHMGASLLGHHCDRYLWLNFRWAIQESFPGRILRLFRRGHKEEDWVIADLRAIGIHVFDTQRRVIFGCHVSGSIDGMVKNVPHAPKSQAILEIKTHSLKSFNDLTKNGVEKSKPQHWVQMHTYMHGTNTSRALYYAVCKDDDRIHTEWIHYDKAVAEKYINRGKVLALTERMPPPVSSDPTWYQCKMCAAHAFCHEKAPVKHANCRTCAHVTPKEDGTFFCESWSATIPEDHQHDGCDNHIIHPDLVPWSFEGSDDGSHVTWDIDGVKVLNGPNGYKSREIVANPAACGSKDIEMIKSAFPGAEVIG